MENQTPEQLAAKKCVPCEGGVEPYPLDKAQKQVAELDGWRLTRGGKRVRRDWQAKDFMAGMAFLAEVAQTAEQEGHHPDVHLEGYRKLWIEVWTHAIGGLSENDFILAAKINQLPLESI